ALHAAAVVGDDDPRAPTVVERDLDRGRSGVERVLDEFLDHRGRTLDDLPRGDAIDERVVENVDAAQGPSFAGGGAGDGCVCRRAILARLDPGRAPARQATMPAPESRSDRLPLPHGPPAEISLEFRARFERFLARRPSFGNRQGDSAQRLLYSAAEGTRGDR